MAGAITGGEVTVRNVRRNFERHSINSPMRDVYYDGPSQHRPQSPQKRLRAVNITTALSPDLRRIFRPSSWRA